MKAAEISDHDSDQDEKEEAPYVIAITKCAATLHRTGGCWRVRKLAFKQYDVIDEDPPSRGRYTGWCRDCWPHSPPAFEDDGASSAGGGDSSSSDSA